jgi:hypothetical protein
MNTFLILLVTSLIVFASVCLLLKKMGPKTFVGMIIGCIFSLIVVINIKLIKDVDFKGLKLTMLELDQKTKQADEKISSAGEVIHSIDSATQQIYRAIGEQYLHLALEDKGFVGDEYVTDEVEKRDKASEYLKKAGLQKNSYKEEFKKIDGIIARGIASNIQDTILAMGTREPYTISRSTAIEFNQELNKAIFKQYDIKIIVSKLKETMKKYSIDEKVVQSEIAILDRFISTGNP